MFRLFCTFNFMTSMKNWDRYIQLHNINTQVKVWGIERLKACIVIPCYDEPDLEQTLQSIEKCEAYKEELMVIVVVNSGINSPAEVKQQNRTTYSQLVEWSNTGYFASFQIKPLFMEGVPRKHAGAGYARKIGMDYAIGLFRQLEREDGIIISLDADCTVSSNFVSAILKAYRNNPRLGLTTQYFEHSLSSTSNNSAMVQYELYLRYFRLGLFYSGFPYPIHTIGSCFSVKADLYVAHGGMNRRQGGEDFYFLHKLVPHTFFKEMNEITVYPSSRFSHRVPFGTGPALKTIAEQDNPYKVYHPESFELLSQFFLDALELFNAEISKVDEVVEKQPEAIRHFLGEMDFTEKMQKVIRNASRPDTFKKRYFQLVDAFVVVKLLNYLHETVFEKLQVVRAAKMLLEKLQVEPDQNDTVALLNQYRLLDRNEKFPVIPE